MRRRDPPLPAAAAATPDDCETDDNVLREIRTLQDGICLDACRDDATKAHGTNGVKGPVAVAVRVTLTRLAPKSPVRRRHRRRWGDRRRGRRERTTARVLYYIIIITPNGGCYNIIF